MEYAPNARLFAPRPALRLALFLVLVAILISQTTTAAVFETIYYSSNTSPANPAGGLTLGTDGYLYGTSFSGGTSGLGAIFTVASNGSLVTVASFDGTNGANPRGTMVSDGFGNLFGIAYAGGTNSNGTVFELTLSGQLNALHTFGSDTANPYGSLAIGPDGNLYGTTETYASVFRISPSGDYTNLTSFFGLNGYSLQGGLVLGNDGNFYGAAGFKSPAQSGGLIFTVTTNGVVTVLTQFNASNGDQPYGGLTLGSDGKFYGTTTGGGLYNQGTAFSVTTNGVFTKLIDFDGTNGAYPFAPLTVGADGKIYGSTLEPSDIGTLFSLTTGGTFSTVHYFSSWDGAEPDGKLSPTADGGFLGTSRLGGANGNGCIFEYFANGAVTNLSSLGASMRPRAGLIQGADGNFYGATGAGVFRMAANGSVSYFASFAGLTGQTSPAGELFFDAQGNLYGSADQGGLYGDDSIFRVTSNGVVDSIFTFVGTNGASPVGGLVQGIEGSFYGTTETGGFGFGTVFKLSTNGILTVLVDFDQTNGTFPLGGLTAGSDGSLYGTTSAGGEGIGYGTVFHLSPDGDFNLLITFDGTNGAYPSGNLVWGRDGALYGTTYGDANQNDTNGTIFSLTTNGILTTLFHFSGTNGSGPADLTFGVDGNFYGTTSEGGDHGLGTIYTMDYSGDLTVLHSFSADDGGTPVGKLYLGSDGYLYGTTAMDGDARQGSIFRIYQSPSMQIGLANGQSLISWPASATAAGYLLETSGDLTNPNGWTAVSDPPLTNGIQLVMPGSPSGASQFFRLRQP